MVPRWTFDRPEDYREPAAVNTNLPRTFTRNHEKIHKIKTVLYVVRYELTSAM